MPASDLAVLYSDDVRMAVAHLFVRVRHTARSGAKPTDVTVLRCVSAIMNCEQRVVGSLVTVAYHILQLFSLMLWTFQTAAFHKLNLFLSSGDMTK